MTRRIKPDEIAQAQRFARELAESPVLPLAPDRESTRDMLDRLDHNAQDFEERDDDDA